MDAEAHYWHTCSDCGHDWPVPAEGNTCPICGEPPRCAVDGAGECIDDDNDYGMNTNV